MIRDAREYFDRYIVTHTDARRLWEVLTYTHLFDSQCIGIILRIKREMERP